MNPALRRASALSLLGLALAAGCTGPGRYTREGVGLAEEKMSILKAGTEWKMAHQAFLAGDLDKALRRVDASLSLNDNVTKSHVLRGRILLEQGSLGPALESLLTAETIDPNDPDAQYYLGIVYERLDQPELACDHYQRACELDGYTASYAVAAAEMLIDLGRIDEAATYLQSDPMFHHDAAVQQALGHIAMIQGDPARAADLFQQASLLAPDDLAIVEDLVRAHMLIASYSLAEQNLLRLLSVPDASPRRDLLHLRAQCLTALDRPVDARDIYHDLLEGDQGASDVSAWVGLGNVSVLLDDQRTLRRCASRVVALEPNNADGYSLWALYHRNQGELDRALASIDRAIEVDPDAAEMRAFRGVLLAESGRRSDAVAAFTDALMLAPENPGYRAMLDRAELASFASVPASTD